MKHFDSIFRHFSVCANICIIVDDIYMQKSPKNLYSAVSNNLLPKDFVFSLSDFKFPRHILQNQLLCFDIGGMFVFQQGFFIEQKECCCQIIIICLCFFNFPPKKLNSLIFLKMVFLISLSRNIFQGCKMIPASSVRLCQTTASGNKPSTGNMSPASKKRS